MTRQDAAVVTAVVTVVVVVFLCFSIQGHTTGTELGPRPKQTKTFFLFFFFPFLVL